MHSVSLGEMSSVKLMDRMDSKYVTDEMTLAAVLDDASAAGYSVLVADGARVSQYDTLYYDTSGLGMYLAHQDGHLHRQKVRTRVYVGSGLTFLEVKRKDNHGRTDKRRLEIPQQDFKDFSPSEEASAFLADTSGYCTAALSPALETIFRRITLVDAGRTERVTLDTCLCFDNPRTAEEVSLRDAVIIEVKRDGRRASGGMEYILREHRVKPMRESKYCLGIALTDPSAKSNLFKSKVRAISKIIGYDLHQTVFVHICRNSR